MKHDHHKATDIELMVNGVMPFPDCSLFIFETSLYPECILHLNREDGILMTCDSVKNWTKPDDFFSISTAKLYQQLEFFGEATISKIWQQACQVKAQDFLKLQSLAFKHLLSAHGEPLLNEAHERLTETIKEKFDSQ